MSAGEVHVTDTASIAARGVYAGSLSTNLASEWDAENRGLLVLARQAEPAWGLEGVAVDLQLISLLSGVTPEQDQEATGDVLGLEMHDLVEVAGMPAGSPYTTTMLWVEGWTETISHQRWRISLAVSDYCRNAALEIWDDVDAAVTWDTAPDVTWDDITCSPPTGAGTWNDVPARTHWDTAPATITWDTAEDLWPS